MSKYRDSLVGAISMAIAVVLFIATFSIEEFTRTSLGADFVPRVTALILAALGVLLILRDGKARRALAGSGETCPVPPPVNKVGLCGTSAVALNVVLFAAYLALLETIGFVLLTPVYLFLQILILTDPAKYRIPRFVLLSVAVSLAAYYMFVNVFQVMLPNGLLS